MLVWRVDDEGAVVDGESDVEWWSTIAHGHDHRAEEDCEVCCVPVLDSTMKYESVGCEHVIR